MSPRNQQFTPEAILEEALALVESEGIDALSARSLAARIGTSVAPVYGAYPAMETLRKTLLDKAAALLADTIANQHTGKVFLDMGVGIVLFSRDHKRLFEALLNSGGSQGCLGRFKEDLRASLDLNTALISVAQDRMDPIFERMWLFTLGTACALIHGFLQDQSDKAVRALMESQGVLVFVGEAASGGRLSENEISENWQRFFSGEQNGKRSQG